MDKLKAMQLYVRVVELGSFSRVAEQLGTSKSMISKQISQLEDNLGVRLLQRSTRRLQMTELGEDYLVSCREILKRLEDTEVQLQASQHSAKGRLRINVPMALGSTVLAPALAAFMKQYPQIELDVELSDMAQDLLEHNFDLGLRVASREFDSAYVGKKITKFSYSICASPEYLATHPTIQTPQDLQQHHCFEYSYFRHKNLWPVGVDPVPIAGPLKANSSVFLLEMIKQGLGIGYIPRFICHRALQAGEVVEILDDATKPIMTLFALYPVRQYTPPKVKYFIEFLEAWFEGHPYQDEDI
ncbi:LysR family transcriptional regulator [Motilimonas cestriensis]|uniref:LysR family transcriptional regulator n=1 Tax=Motilimonas cestriensis TaxID=2742685 RepID=A0ABS8WBN7_9GAMM|nr:LysR family transcriptional regulator [Motilimonas cestriensis]MCE2596431.1 LysR family transcriptional regulator [Motilimonas cestriensis]